MKRSWRLVHFLSSAPGGVSRRKAFQLIKEGQVEVNGHPERNPSRRVFPQKELVRFKGQALKPEGQKWHIAFNKPKKVLTSLSDPKGRVCVSSYFPKVRERLFPVGRLDWDSEGLLLLTNDGSFANRVLREKPPKTYMVKLHRSVDEARLHRLRKGLGTEVGHLKALYADFCRGRNPCWAKVIIAEGRNRQVHRMFEKVGLKIKVLRRVAIGRLKLKKLKPGAFFLLSSLDKKKVFSPPPEL